MRDLSSAELPDTPPIRLLSLDVFRGLIMCTLAVNGFAVAATAKKLGYGPDVDANSAVAWIWQTLAFHNSHPPWNSQFHLLGCSFWDLIQPAFMFMVGVAMPYSYASRKRGGTSEFGLASHAFLRALVLVLIGVFLQTRNSGLATDKLFTNVLTQIGLGYFFVYLVMSFRAKAQIAVVGTVLAVYTVWMVTFSLPESLPQDALQSIESLTVPSSIVNQFAIGVNAAAQADHTILNLIPHDQAIPPHPAGYATLNFIPSSMTMLIGVLAGVLLRSPVSPNQKLRRLILAGMACMTLAVVASFTVCPVIKRIWTPAWTLFSAAYVLWALAMLYWMIDIRHWRRWTYPLVVVGTNSLAMYLMSMLWKRWISDRFTTYLGADLFGGDFGPMIQAVSVFMVLWLICWYLYRNKLFFRI